MSLLIKKVGGSLLKTHKDCQTFADYLIPFYKAHHQLIVVTSAFQGITDRLIAETGLHLQNEEAYELLLSLGEQHACAHLGLALYQGQIPYQVFCGKDVGIFQNDDGTFEVDFARYRQAVQTSIVIVSGFQVLNDHHQWVNLGRGGSDLTALILAHMLHADQCELLKDVPGVYNMDPALGPIGKFFDVISFQDLKNFLHFHPKIIQEQAARFAITHQQKFSVANLDGLQTQISVEKTRLRF